MVQPGHYYPSQHYTIIIANITLICCGAQIWPLLSWPILHYYVDQDDDDPVDHNYHGLRSDLATFIKRPQDDDDDQIPVDNWYVWLDYNNN